MMVFSDDGLLCRHQQSPIWMWLIKFQSGVCEKTNWITKEAKSNLLCVIISHVLLYLISHSVPSPHEFSPNFKACGCRDKLWMCNAVQLQLFSGKDEKWSELDYKCTTVTKVIIQCEDVIESYRNERSNHHHTIHSEGSESLRLSWYYHVLVKHTWTIYVKRPLTARWIHCKVSLKFMIHFKEFIKSELRIWSIP